MSTVIEIFGFVGEKIELCSKIIYNITRSTCNRTYIHSDFKIIDNFNNFVNSNIFSLIYSKILTQC